MKAQLEEKCKTHQYRVKEMTKCSAAKRRENDAKFTERGKS